MRKVTQTAISARIDNDLLPMIEAEVKEDGRTTKNRILNDAVRMYIDWMKAIRHDRATFTTRGRAEFCARWCDFHR